MISKIRKGSQCVKCTLSMATSLVRGESDSNEDSLNEEEMRLFVRRYNRYIERNDLKHNDKNLVNFRKTLLKGKESEKEEKIVSCFGCGKVGHYKNEYPELTKGKGKSNSNRSSRGRRAYIAWEDDDTTFMTSNSENDEVANLCLMGNTKKKKKNEITYSDPDFEFKPSYEELQQEIEEMHG